MRRSRILIMMSVAVIGTALAWHGAARREPPAKHQPTPARDENEPLTEFASKGTDMPSQTRMPAPLSAAPATAIPSANPADEQRLMSRLRELGPRDPELSLRLARDGDMRFPSSPDAAERGWFAVRALVDLRRMDEAVTEARVMVQRYPDTSFAHDVERHLLTHPMRHPTEVGYQAED